jgi:hypothetical protein
VALASAAPPAELPHNAPESAPAPALGTETHAASRHTARFAFAPKPAASPTLVAEARAKDCAIPFTIDELGHKHYKVECVH